MASRVQMIENLIRRGERETKSRWRRHIARMRAKEAQVEYSKRRKIKAS